MNNKYYLKFKETIRTSTSTNDHTSVATRMAKTSLVYLREEKAWNNWHGAFSKVAVKAEVTTQSQHAGPHSHLHSHPQIFSTPVLTGLGMGA